jgi:flagellar biosynthesis protein
MNGKKTVKEAAALKYDAKKDDAPYIVGLGQGVVAENIVKTAKENAIPVVEDRTLAHLLNKLSVGDEIPEELYQMVAQVLVFVTNLDKDYGNRFGLKKV